MTMMFRRRYAFVLPQSTAFLLAVVCLLLAAVQAAAFPLPPSSVRTLVQSFKQDPRGPFQAIRWFCPDGSVLPAKERCQEPGGIQHALPKGSVLALRDNYHLFLGQILAGTSFADFLDAPHNYSRLKQYQLEKFLQTVDNGWILRKVRHYRGAFQAEDEEKWGSDFLRFVLDNEHLYKEKFFLIREAVRDLPHRGGHTDRWRQVRAEAGAIAETEPAFADLRVKLHGRPDRDDIVLVEHFLAQHRQTLPEESRRRLAKLVADLRAIYETGALQQLAPFAENMPVESPLLSLLAKLRTEIAKPAGEDRLPELRILADILWQSRLELGNTLWPERRLILLDLSLTAEDAICRLSQNWRPSTIGALFEKYRLLAKAAAGAGYLEIWEWRQVQGLLQPFSGERARLADLQAAAGAGRRLLDWATAIVAAEYRPTVRLFAGFEPLADGFVADRIRSSLLLQLGETAGRLNACLAGLSGRPSQVLDLGGQAIVKGLNPGLALGPLRVVDNPDQKMEYNPGAIYLLTMTPADFKPVAGLLSVEKGNLVSHVQLLARNLGIPSSTVSALQIAAFKRFEGQRLFYAVSPGGRVILKPAGAMSAAELALFVGRRHEKTKIKISTDKQDLSETSLLSLATLRSSDSGRICGPKAANLGQLKSLFPGHVVGGLLIPFGVFRRHLAQRMPDEKVSYWQYLKDTFAAQTQPAGSARPGEKRILRRLARLRRAIGKIPLLPGFTAGLAVRFKSELGRPLGKLGVFVRSDTNMEDLPAFTGAGLNLTVFNVIESAAILQAIRDVWASPFTTRSYLWRQKYMQNPLAVYPSILILPSVAVDKSGVLVTSGIEAGSPQDDTVAFNRGVGGAVAGQAAETYLLRADGSRLLLQPSRTPTYRVLSAAGGTVERYNSFSRPVLSPQELAELRQMAARIRKRLASVSGLGPGPYDVELGFKGRHLWLFQARPFNEGRLVSSSAYLRAMDVSPSRDRLIDRQLSVSVCAGTKR